MISSVFSRRTLLRALSFLAPASTSLFRSSLSFGQSASALPPALQGFNGVFISRSNPLYLDWYWAMTWYRVKPTRYPAAFAQPTNEEDLRLLVLYASQENLKISTHSSGHNISAPTLRDNAITIDMSLFNGVDIDVESKSIWAGPGIFSEQLNKLLYEKGFSFPSAHTGFVSIGGFLLGGGMGWNMQNWGMASGSILELELILADGSKVTASPNKNQELFWAARGVGPGFFAIVLRYKLRVYPTPKVVKNIYYFSIDKLEIAAAEMQRLAPASASRSEMLGAIGKFSPPGTPLAEEKWYWVGTIFSFGATQQEAITAAEVFNSSPVFKEHSFQFVHNEPLTFLDLYSQLGTDSFSEFRTSEIALFTAEPGKCLRLIVDILEHNQVDSRSFGFSEISCNPTVPEPCSYSYTQPHYISWYLISNSEEDVKRNEDIARHLYTALSPYVTSYYINEIDLNLFPEAVKQCFTPEKWQKLEELRQKYDPEKRFVSYVGID